MACPILQIIAEPLPHHPLLQMVRSVLLIARHGWPHDAVMSLVKSGLAGFTDDQADELEKLRAAAPHPAGRMWESTEPWAFKRELITEEDESGLPVVTQTQRIDSYRRSLQKKLSPLLDLGKKTVGDSRNVDSALCGVGNRLKFVPRSCNGWQKPKQTGDLETRQEHEQVWSEFTQLFDHLVELLGDQAITLIDFINVLDSGLESFDLALTPVKVDQILVGQIDRTRAPGFEDGVCNRIERGNFSAIRA